MEFKKGKGEIKAEIIINGAKKFEEYGFEGKDGEVLVLPEKKRIYVGIENLNAENIKTATALVIKSLKKYTGSTIKLTQTQSEVEGIRVAVEDLGIEVNFSKQRVKEQLIDFITKSL